MGTITIITTTIVDTITSTVSTATIRTIIAHDDDVKSFVSSQTVRLTPQSWKISWAPSSQIYGPKMLRYKGVLYVSGMDRKVVFQGVHQLMAAMSAPNGPLARPRPAKWCSLALTCHRTCSKLDWNNVWGETNGYPRASGLKFDCKRGSQSARFGTGRELCPKFKNRI